jgi:hypothetical protein
VNIHFQRFKSLKFKTSGELRNQHPELTNLAAQINWPSTQAKENKV